VSDKLHAVARRAAYRLVHDHRSGGDATNTQIIHDAIEEHLQETGWNRLRFKHGHLERYADWAHTTSLDNLNRLSGFVRVVSNNVCPGCQETIDEALRRVTQSGDPTEKSENQGQKPNEPS